MKHKIRLTESDIRAIVSESVRTILSEGETDGEFDRYGTYHSGREIDAMNKAFGNEKYRKGEEFMTNSDINVVRGK
ncbi:MAG: hypothetical protein J6Y37_00115 [Paludibacteraceae bacterium]|nr:hypothetical protein [Paludibacteraceae bacterium]